MPHIDYYLSPISPNCYLAGLRMEDVAKRHGATVTYKPLDVIGLFGRTGGVPPGQRHESRQEYRLQEMRRNAVKAGLPIHLKPDHWPTNPAPAAYAIIAAQAAGGGDVGALVFGLTRACWAEQRDISQDDVIKSCLTEAGFDPSLAESGLLAGAETYAANMEEAVAGGVFGSPFYVVGQERFWGQDRIEDLDAHLAGTL